MTLTVIIPAYNEEAVLGQTLVDVINWLDTHYPRDYEVIVIDDGSRDRTAAIAGNVSGVVVHTHSRNLGKGAAIKTGAQMAHGDYILFMDADNSTQIVELPAFRRRMEEGVDIAIGSRAMPESKIGVPQPSWKQNLGKIGNTFIRLMVLPGISDTQCGFKLFRRSTCAVLFRLQRLKGFAFDIELLALARWHGLKIIELPVHWRNNFDSTVKLHHYITTLMAVFGIQLARWLGKYSTHDR